MVRIPSFTRRTGTTGTAPNDQDGAVDTRDEQTGQPVRDARAVKVRDQIDDRGPRHATGTAPVGPDVARRPDPELAPADKLPADPTATDQTVPDRATTDRATTDRATTDRATTDRAVTDRPATGHTTMDQTVTDQTVTDRTAPDHTAPGRTVERPPARKARASLLATLGLVIGVVSALMVLSGVLAGYGIALAVLGLLLSLGGVSATSRRHVAGKSDALLGVALCVGAMVVGGLALTGALSWLTTETDKVEQFRQWLDTQFIERF